MLIKRTLLAITFSIILFCNTAYSAMATLSWNHDSEPNLAGFKVYYGKSSGTYDLVIDVGNRFDYTVNGLTEGETYFFAATAYDFSGNESDFSNEVIYGVPEVPTLNRGQAKKKEREKKNVDRK